MSGRHLSFKRWRARDAGELPDRELRAIALAHLRDLCQRCAASLDTLEAVLRDGAGRSRLGRGRAWRAVALGLAPVHAAFEGDLATARRELAILRRLPPDRRLQRVERSRTRYRSPILVELLLLETGNRLKHKPRKALHWLDVAAAAVRRALSDLVDLEHTEPLRELMARVRGQRANALRVLGELPAADQAFTALAMDYSTEALSSPVRAELLSLEASLRQDQRRLDEADRLLTRAASLYREAANGAALGRIFLQQGIVRSLADQPARAIEVLKSAAHQLTIDQHPALHLAARHGIALSLCQLGDFAAARLLVRELEPLYRRFDDPWTQLRRAWVEGQIAAGLGEDESALERFESTRSGYLELELPYDAAMVALDLAELRLRGGEIREVELLAEEMVDVFERIEVHRETGRALALLGRAAAAETLTIELIRQLRAYLLRARSEPGLVFDGAGYSRP